MSNPLKKHSEKAPNKVKLSFIFTYAVSFFPISDEDHVSSSISINQLIIFTFLAK